MSAKYQWLPVVDTDRDCAVVRHQISPGLSLRQMGDCSSADRQIGLDWYPTRMDSDFATERCSVANNCCMAVTSLEKLACTHLKWLRRLSRLVHPEGSQATKTATNFSSILYRSPTPSNPWVPRRFSWGFVMNVFIWGTASQWLQARKDRHHKRGRSWLSLRGFSSTQ